MEPILEIRRTVAGPVFDPGEFALFCGPEAMVEVWWEGNDLVNRVMAGSHEPQYDGGRCPACGARQLKPEPPTADHVCGVRRTVNCDQCGANWEEILRLEGYHDLRDRHMRPLRPGEPVARIEGRVVVCLHTVDYVYDTSHLPTVCSKLREELEQEAARRAEDRIRQGYTQGVLSCPAVELGEEVHGWWRVQR